MVPWLDACWSLSWGDLAPHFGFFWGKQEESPYRGNSTTESFSVQTLINIRGIAI